MSDRVSVSPITDDTRRKAFALARENWDRMRLASVTGIDAEYETCAVNLIVGKVLDLVGGVPTGCAATAGAQVAREQTPVADTTVSAVTDDMVARMEQAWPQVWLGGDLDWRGKLGALLSAALAGYTAPTPPRGEVAASMARARQWLAHHGGERSGMPVPTWDGLTPAEQELAELEARHWIQAAVNAGVKIVPTGWRVVERVEPTGVTDDGDAWWEYPGGKVWSRANGRFSEETAARFRGMALALLAAVEHNELRHGAGSQVGDAR